MTSIHIFNALAGAGKTRALVIYADKLAQSGTKVLIVQPTKQLIDKTLADEFTPLQPAYPIKAIHSDNAGQGVVKAITAHFKRAVPGEGEVLAITQSSFFRLPFIERKSDWVVLMDEAPQVDVFDSWKLPETHSLITDLVDLDHKDAPYAAMVARPSKASPSVGSRVKSLHAVARNEHDDDVLKTFTDFAKRVCSEHWEVSVSPDGFKKLVDGMSDRLDTHSVLRPSIFDGFKRVIVASACMEETMFARLMAAQGVTLKPVGTDLTQHLRYTEHAQSSAITIYYACEEAWSKRFRDSTVKDDLTDQSARLLDWVRRSIVQLFQDDRFLWMGNKDLEDTVFGVPNATRLPNAPHGLNSYQDFHNVAVISALNPPPQHFHFLKMQGLDEHQVRTAHFRSAAYQAIMRCSIRNPSDASPKRVVVMDRDTALWLAGLFPGAEVQQLAGMPLTTKGKPGRHRDHPNSARRQAAHRAQKKEEHLKALGAINAGSFQASGYVISDFKSVCFSDSKSCYENTLSNRYFVTPQAANLYGSLFNNIHEKNSFGLAELSDDAEFIGFLELAHQRVLPKDDASLLSPAVFDPNLTENTKRGLANITHVRGIWLDNDGGDLTHQAFADLLPNLRVVVWNTASSTSEMPRWRAFIPTDLAMTADIHKLIINQIVLVLERAGYWGQRKLTSPQKPRDGRSHGFDESKFTASSLFYLPVQAKVASDSFFIDYGATDLKRGPLSVLDWLDRCIKSLPLEPETVAVPNLNHNYGLEVSSNLQAVRLALRSERAKRLAGSRDQKVQAAVQEWRLTPPGAGNGAFFRLGVALRQAGLDETEIADTLKDQAHYGRSPSDRRNEVKGIIKSLGRLGTLGR